MPKILLVDTCYPEFLKSLPFDSSSIYEVELRKMLDRSFGTADFYSRNLRALGWDAMDVIANHEPLQKMWDREHGWNISPDLILNRQIETFKPDVVFFQDLSLLTDATFWNLREKYLLAGQCSCPMPSTENIQYLDCAFTSFPHYVKRFEALGVRAIYNPLAFEPIVLERANLVEVTEPGDAFRAWARRFTERPHDVVFIGGVGNPSHWRYGMEVLETVAREIPTFKWWGYGVETLAATSALREKYQGKAWGLDMHEILLQSKICLNRHGEVAEGYANNMRMFEASGCGALLLTEDAPNLRDFFTDYECISYTSAKNAAEQVRWALDNWQMLAAGIARAGQQRTLRDHTYEKRMKMVSETLFSMLCPA